MKQIPIFVFVFLATLLMSMPAGAQSLTWHTDRFVSGVVSQATLNTRVAISGSNAVAVWEQSDGSKLRIYANHSSDGGLTWQGAQVIENFTTVDGRDPQVAVSGNNVVVVWTLDASGGVSDIYATRATFSGSTLNWIYANALPVENNAGSAMFPHLAMSGSNVVAVWSQFDGSDCRTYASYSSNAGVSWLGNVPLETTSSPLVTRPRIAISGLNVIAVWTSYDVSDYYRVYTNRAVFSGGSGGTLIWPQNAKRLDNSNLASEPAPQVALSGSNIVAVWEGRSGASAYRVYKAYSSDAGINWSADTFLQTNDTVNAGGPQVAIASGNAVAVWLQEEVSGGGLYRIYARHSFNGGSSWSAPELIEDNATSTSSAHLALSGDNAIAVWTQLDAIYYRVNSNYASFSGSNFIAISDGGGGCFIATTAFGSPLAGQVDILRKFRDGYLLTNSLGRKFVDWYYQNGPTAAKFIENKPLAKAFVQASLYPLVGFSFLLINGYLPFVMIGLMLAALIFFRFRPGKSGAR
jgi:hypothetical protein